MIIATAEELHAATVSMREKTREDSLEEKNRKWMEWFVKRSEKMLSDTVRKGLFEMTLDLPYQPLDRSYWDSLKKLGRELKRKLPGCTLAFVEEEYEENVIYRLEISWKTLRH
jgi:hypothetical protein